MLDPNLYESAGHSARSQKDRSQSELVAPAAHVPASRALKGSGAYCACTNYTYCACVPHARPQQVVAHKLKCHKLFCHLPTCVFNDGKKQTASSLKTMNVLMADFSVIT